MLIWLFFGKSDKGLAHPGKILDQHVARSDQADHDLIDDIVLPPDIPHYVRFQAIQCDLGITDFLRFEELTQDRTGEQATDWLDGDVAPPQEDE